MKRRHRVSDVCGGRVQGSSGGGGVTVTEGAAALYCRRPPARRRDLWHHRHRRRRCRRTEYNGVGRGGSAGKTTERIVSASSRGN